MKDLTRIEMINFLRDYFMKTDFLTEENEPEQLVGYFMDDEERPVVADKVIEFFDKEIAAYEKKRETDKARRAKKSAEHAEFDNKVYDKIVEAGEEGTTATALAIALTNELGDNISTSKIAAAVKRIAEEKNIRKDKIGKSVGYFVV